TRSYGDWSSDVCSSDLRSSASSASPATSRVQVLELREDRSRDVAGDALEADDRRPADQLQDARVRAGHAQRLARPGPLDMSLARSEERRVGKDGSVRCD